MDGRRWAGRKGKCAFLGLREKPSGLTWDSWQCGLRQSTSPPGFNCVRSTRPGIPSFPDLKESLCMRPGLHSLGTHFATPMPQVPRPEHWATNQPSLLGMWDF